MARPRKFDQKLQKASVNLPPPLFDAVDAVARQEGKPLAQKLRELVEQGFGKPKPMRV